MNSISFNHALEQTLQMQANGASLAQCLIRFPQHANDLAPLLEAAALTRTGLNPAIPKPNLARSKARFIQAARPQPTTPLFLRLAFALALAVVVLTYAGVTLTYASASALPGDALYPIKLGLERLELAITLDPAERDLLQASQAERRRAEAQTAALQRRDVQLSFEGVVEDWRADVLIVSGLVIRVVEADVQIGDRIRIEARTVNGEIVAERINVLERPSRIPPPARPTATPDPTRQVRPSLTLVPTRPTETRPSLTPADVRPTSSPTDSRPAIRATTETRPTESRPTSTQTSIPSSRPADARSTPAPTARP